VREGEIERETDKQAERQRQTDRETEKGGGVHRRKVEYIN